MSCPVPCVLVVNEITNGYWISYFAIGLPNLPPRTQAALAARSWAGQAWFRLGGEPGGGMGLWMDFDYSTN